MALKPDAQWLPDAEELIAEHSLGRGRVVMTGFPLRDQRIARWKYFSNLLSSGILRRPARTVEKQEFVLKQCWAAPHQNMEFDPRLNSNLRFVTRDLPISRITKSEAASAFASQGEMEIEQRQKLRNLVEPEKVREPMPTFSEQSLEAVQWSPNGAAWNDTSGIAFRAASALRDAAGIVLPSRWTILCLIGGYLSILVPLNWLVFRLMGRLEFAWVAAPIIAVIGVIVVTRVARLDIGFARRTTDLSVVEIYGEYPRAHVTTYAALYTSLSTNYTVDFPERGSIALPFGDISRRMRRASETTRTLQAIYGENAGIQLKPVTVYSNSTEMLHSEQMTSLEGGIMYGLEGDSEMAAIKNKTKMKLKSCCLVRKKDDGQIQFAWFGDLEDDSTKKSRLMNASLDESWKHWNESSITREPVQDSESPPEQDSGLVVGGLLHELLYALPLVPGQARLLAYSDERAGKFELQPSNEQSDSRSVIVVHLSPAKFGPITRDKQMIGRLPNEILDLQQEEAASKADPIN